MLKVTVTAYDSPVTVQDPRPVSQTGLEQGAYSVEANTTKTMLMQWGQLERIASQLVGLQARGLCNFVIEGADTGFAEQADSASNPQIDYADDGDITDASQALVVTGTNLLAGQSIASARVDGDTAAGHVLVEAVNPSGEANLYDVEVVDSGGVGGLAVAVNIVAGRTVITIDLDGSAAEDCTSVAAILNNPLSATYGLVHATVVGVGATPITTVQDITPFTGGAGSGMSVLLAGLACIVEAIDITADPIHVLTLATPDITALGLGAGAPLTLQVRSNSKLATATLTHA